jgi:hypothetical protein
MSEYAVLAVAGTFGGALALFITTSIVALPLLALEKARAPLKSRRR